VSDTEEELPQSRVPPEPLEEFMKTEKEIKNAE
jgi:hypothetical protein